MKTTLIRLFALAILATSIPALAAPAQSKDGQMSAAHPSAVAGNAQQPESRSTDDKEMKQMQEMKPNKEMKKMKKKKVEKDHNKNQDENYDPLAGTRG